MKNIFCSLAALVLLAGCNAYKDNLDHAVKVKTIGASEIYSDGVVLAGAVDAAASVRITEAGFLFDSVAINPATIDPANVHAAQSADGSFSGSFSVAIDELMPSTKYYAMAFAADANGGRYYGQQVSLKTNPLTTPPVISNPVVVSTAVGSATLQGTLVSDDPKVPTAWFGVKYWPKDGDESAAAYDSIPGAPKNPVAKGGSFQVTVTGVAPGTYSFRMCARNDRHWAESPIANYEFTIEAPVVSAPTVHSPVAGTAIAEGDQLTVTCTFVSDGGDPDNLVYGVVYKLKPAITDMPDDTWERVEAPAGPINAGDTYTVTITGLQEKSLYGLAAYASNSTGTYYDVLINEPTYGLVAPTFQVVPYGVNDFDSPLASTGEKPVGTDYIYVQANINNDGENTFDVYDFVYDTDPAFSNPKSLAATFDGTTGFSAKLAGLDAATPQRYYFKAHLHTDGGFDFYSPVYAFKQAMATADLLYPGTLLWDGWPTMPNWVDDPNYTLYYYEMPAITVGAKKYYFLDRNIGARQATTDESFTRIVGTGGGDYTLLVVPNGISDGSTGVDSPDVKAIGYWYFFDNKRPVTLASDRNNGINNSDINSPTKRLVGWPASPGYAAPPDGTVWKSTNNPCPAGYNVPTKADMDYLFSQNYSFYPSTTAAPFDRYITGFRKDINAIWPIGRNNANGALNAPRQGGVTGIWVQEGLYYITSTTTDAGAKYTTNCTYVAPPFGAPINPPNLEYAFPIRCLRVE